MSLEKPPDVIDEAWWEEFDKLKRDEEKAEARAGAGTVDDGDDDDEFPLDADGEDDDLESYVESVCRERERLRPPKRNNVKKYTDPQYLEQLIAQCEAATNAVRDCSACNSRGSLVCDDASASYICSRCGAVAAGVRPDVCGPVGRVRTRAAVSARLNYFKERLSQWARAQPVIPAEGVQSLRAAYATLRNVDGPDRVSDELTKPEVRRLVLEAGLPAKMCVEKWLWIRNVVRDNVTDDCPQPSQALLEFCEWCFVLFLRAWLAHPELRGGRTSLPNINFLFRNFFLMRSAETYEIHAKWFPQVTVSKLACLQKIWEAFCNVLEWPIYFAEYDFRGVLHRRRQRCLAFPAPALAQSHTE